MWAVEWDQETWVFSCRKDLFCWAKATLEHPRKFGAVRPRKVTELEAPWYRELFVYEENFAFYETRSPKLFEWRSVPQKLRNGNNPGLFRFIPFLGFVRISVASSFRLDVFTEFDGWVCNIHRGSLEVLKSLPDESIRDFFNKKILAQAA